MRRVSRVREGSGAHATQDEERSATHALKRRGRRAGPNPVSGAPAPDLRPPAGRAGARPAGSCGGVRLQRRGEWRRCLCSFGLRAQLRDLPAQGPHLLGHRGCVLVHHLLDVLLLPDVIGLVQGPGADRMGGVWRDAAGAFPHRHGAGGGRCLSRRARTLCTPRRKRWRRCRYAEEKQRSR